MDALTISGIAVGNAVVDAVVDAVLDAVNDALVNVLLNGYGSRTTHKIQRKEQPTSKGSLNANTATKALLLFRRLKKRRLLNYPGIRSHMVNQ